jgi:hypothetical protein
MCPFGEIGVAGLGCLIGVLGMIKLCWHYLKSKFGKKKCACDCCHHKPFPSRLANSTIDKALGVPHDPSCHIVHGGSCDHPEPLP